MSIINKDELIRRILLNRDIDKSFNSITDNFDVMFNEFNPINNCFPLKKYFGKGKGFATAKKEMLYDNVIKADWLSGSNDDFMGVYIFFNNDLPFYVGISRGVIKRILQHLKGKSLNTSTLAHKIGLINYELKYKKEFEGRRKELDFKSEVEPIKEFLLDQNIAILNIENDEELYLFEVYCAMKFNLGLNKFRTH